MGYSRVEISGLKSSRQANSGMKVVGDFNPERRKKRERRNAIHPG
ncbi:MAG: hypothetical protein ACTSRA_12545 [Promethearchaeota archaeon]